MQDVQRLLRSNSVLYCWFVQHRTKFCGSFFQVRVTLVLAFIFADQAYVLDNQPHISNCQNQFTVLEIHDLPKHAGAQVSVLCTCPGQQRGHEKNQAKEAAGAEERAQELARVLWKC